MDIMISFVGYSLAIFVFGVAVGKLEEKIERFISKHDDKEHKDTKNDRH